MKSPPERNRYWIYVWLWTGLIYTTLYIVRPICTYLKAHTPFVLIVNAGMFLGAGFFMVHFIRLANRKFIHYAIFMCAFLGYLIGCINLKYPEEKIHFLEYGVLVYFSYMALDQQKSVPKRMGIAFLLTAFLGLIDELIQGILPNRYYQTQDVALNAISALLALMLIKAFNK